MFPLAQLASALGISGLISSFTRFWGDALTMVKKIDKIADKSKPEAIFEKRENQTTHLREKNLVHKNCKEKEVKKDRSSLIRKTLITKVENKQ